MYQPKLTTDKEGMSCTTGGGSFGGAYKKGHESWRRKHQRGRWNVHMMDKFGNSRAALVGVSKRRAKAALLNWCSK
jgi:hypothetical protein